MQALSRLTLNNLSRDDLLYNHKDDLLPCETYGFTIGSQYKDEVSLMTHDLHVKHICLGSWVVINCSPVAVSHSYCP